MKDATGNDIHEFFIRIDTDSEEEKLRIGNEIHEQLRGNDDYINNRIILDISQPGIVYFWKCADCQSSPEITIKL